MTIAVLADRAGMSSATTGTGSTITLEAALGAVAPNVCSFQDFGTAGITNGQVVSYLIFDSNGNFEYGHATFSTSGPSLTGRTPLGSSNAGAAISLSGNQQVFLTALAEDIVTNIVAGTGLSGGTLQNGGTVAITNPVVATAPTHTILTAGSGTYTTPAGVKWLRVRMVGGGGGGAGGSTTSGGATNGGTGGNTTFGSSFLAANGGAGGAAGGGMGAIGGTASLASGATGIALQGGSGAPGSYTGASTYYNLGGNGASTPFGGGGCGGYAGQVGQAAITNSGAGGGGGGTTNASSAPGGIGAGAGGFIDAIIASPLSSYGYAVGASGSAGTGAPGSGYNGGSGGSGIIIIEEHYNY